MDYRGTQCAGGEAHMLQAGPSELYSQDPIHTHLLSENFVGKQMLPLPNEVH